MSEPEFERAKRHALGRLEAELAPDLYYHNAHHTRDGVIPAAIRYARLNGVNHDDVCLLAVAAAFHDVGFIYRLEGHEIAGARVAAQTLPDYGFSSGQIETVMAMILATRLPQRPYNLLEEILADSDLDVLGRDDYFARNELLRREMAAYGRTLTDEEWRLEQLDFLRSHVYFTATARKLRQPGKERNIAKIEQQMGS
jgi:predicted metal-dependent HD superfamily phosphohydrolase